MDNIEFSRISEDNANWLDRPFDKDSLGVLKSYNGDKASRMLFVIIMELSSMIDKAVSVWAYVKIYGRYLCKKSVDGVSSSLCG